MFSVIGAGLFFGSAVGLKPPLSVRTRLPALTMVGGYFLAAAIPATANVSFSSVQMTLLSNDAPRTMSRPA